MADNERDGTRSGNGGRGSLSLPASVRVVPVACSDGAISATHHWAVRHKERELGMWKCGFERGK